jgi:hypothetical protein
VKGGARVDCDREERRSGALAQKSLACRSVSMLKYVEVDGCGFANCEVVTARQQLWWHPGLPMTAWFGSLSA